MAEADWSVLGGAGALDTANLARGVSNGFTPPNGGGNFVFGFNSKTTAIGAAGLYIDQADFTPIQTPASAGGATIRAAIKRGVSGGETDFAPFLFIGAGGTNVDDQAYLLGLQDDDPHRIVLRKGSIITGVPAGVVGVNGILMCSTASYSNDTWLHVRIDMIVNGTGDVILQCFENDLTANAVTAPAWTAIDGMTEFVDDSLGVNSGSAPFTSGYAGFAFYTAGQSRRGFFDHVEIARQLP